MEWWKQILDPVVALAVAVLTAAAVAVARKLLAWLGAKISWGDSAADMDRKERIVEAVARFADVCVRDTAQTFAEALKDAAADGKLTPEERGTAFVKAKDALVDALKTQGIILGRDVANSLLNRAIETAVLRVSRERKTSLGKPEGDKPAQ